MALFKLAARNLRRNRRRTAITLAALIIGVGVMVVLRGFINGQQVSILENIVQGRIGAVQVHKKGYVKNVLASPLNLDMADTPELRAKISSVPGVKAVAARIDFGAMISTPDKKPQPEDGSPLPAADQGKTSYFLASAIEPLEEGKVTPKRHALVNQGRMFPTSDSAEIVLNADFAVGLETAIHPASQPLPDLQQRIALLAADRDSALNGENVVLGGSFPTFAPGDKRVGLVPIATAQRLLRMEGRVTEYGIAVEPPERAAEVRDALQASLGSEYEVHTWYELFPFIKSLTGTQDFIFSIVSGVFLLVVLLGIVNAMLMSVLERTREIGTMLAVGMRRRKIVSLFLAEGLVIGAIGGALGVAIGYAIVLWLNHTGIPLPAPGATAPSVIRPFVGARFVFAIIFGAPLGAAIATLWPAWRASRLRPVEALQTA